MSEPTDAELEQRYRTRLLSELAELGASSGQTLADRRPADLDQQSVGQLSRVDTVHQQGMFAAQESRRLNGGECGHWVGYGEFIGTERLYPDSALMRCVESAR